MGVAAHQKPVTLVAVKQQRSYFVLRVRMDCPFKTVAVCMIRSSAGVATPVVELCAEKGGWNALHLG